MTALFFVLFFGTMLLLGMPLFASITITVAAMPLFFAGNCGFTLANLGTWMMNGSLSSVGITILLFILAGDVMARGKLTEKLFDTFAYYLGKKQGLHADYFGSDLHVLWCDLRLRSGYDGCSRGDVLPTAEEDGV